MKTVVTLAFLSSLLAFDGDADAHKRRPRDLRARSTRANLQRARRPPPPATPRTLAAREDELTLSSNLLRKLQANLIDGGHLKGSIDGRLTPRTRRALAEFQREYHLPGTGSLDRATAEALLGHEEISTYLIAKK